MSGCESETSSNFLTNSDLVHNWEIISAPGWYSIWTFREDNSYEWYCNWPERYDLSGTGSFYVKDNKLYLTGVLPNSGIIDTEIELTITEDKRQFNFMDNDQEIWGYQIIDPEPEYSKNISFYEQESYSGNCSERPRYTTCLGFPDEYVWLIQGGLLEWQKYYDAEGYVIVGRGYDGFIDFPMEFHHVLNTNLVKRVQRY